MRKLGCLVLLIAAIVVGALAAGLPPEQRKKVILIGVLAALVLRIIFALMVTWLLGIVGLVLAGGLLLLWVAWRMYRDIAGHAGESAGSPEIAGDEHSGIKSTKTFAGAAWGVAVADVSMSLDNVLAVAGAAREHPGILIVGLIFAVALMGVRIHHHDFDVGLLVLEIADRDRDVVENAVALAVFAEGMVSSASEADADAFNQRRFAGKAGGFDFRS